MPSKIAALAIDAVQPRLIAEFWCAVLDWQVVEEDADGVSIAPADGSRMRIDVVAVPEPKSGKNRLHLDLRADGVSTSGELVRLEALGARRVDVGQRDDVSWVVLADPEGNEFCLLSRSAQNLDTPAAGPDARSQRERMLVGDLYIADDPELAAESRRAMTLGAQYNATAPDQPQERRRLLDELLGAVGADTEIRPPMFCDYGYQTHIGAHTFINFGLMALDVARITIGDDVQIGPNVALLTPTHPVAAAPRRAKWEAALPITIGDNVWLGGGVVVLPGVSIGANSVVGAGTVVTRDLPANVIAVGNPARIVRHLDAEE